MLWQIQYKHPKPEVYDPRSSEIGSVGQKLWWCEVERSQMGLVRKSF